MMGHEILLLRVLRMQCHCIDSIFPTIISYNIDFQTSTFYVNHFSLYSYVTMGKIQTALRSSLCVNWCRGWRCNLVGRVHVNYACSCIWTLYAWSPGLDPLPCNCVLHTVHLWKPSIVEARWVDVQVYLWLSLAFETSLGCLIPVSKKKKINKMDVR